MPKKSSIFVELNANERKLLKRIQTRLESQQPLPARITQSTAIKYLIKQSEVVIFPTQSN